MTMLYGYFGGTDYLRRDDPTIAEIADHCTLGFLGTWGLNTGIRNNGMAAKYREVLLRSDK